MYVIDLSSGSYVLSVRWCAVPVVGKSLQYFSTILERYQHSAFIIIIIIIVTVDAAKLLFLVGSRRNKNEIRGDSTPEGLWRTQPSLSEWPFVSGPHVCTSSSFSCFRSCCPPQRILVYHHHDDDASCCCADPALFVLLPSSFRRRTPCGWSNRIQSLLVMSRIILCTFCLALSIRCFFLFLQ